MEEEMTEYSHELRETIRKICNYYEEHDDFTFLQKIMYFNMEGIEYIDDKYFVLSKHIINKYLNDAKIIWEIDGNARKLESLKKLYLNEFQEGLFEEIYNKKEGSAMLCILRVLYNGHDDPTNQFTYDFLWVFINELEKLNVEECKIKRLIEKYFKEII